MKRLALFLIVLLALVIVPVAAQDEAPVGNAEGKTLEIIWPPPVTEVWGVGDVLGTANVPNMMYYYLEYKHLSDDLTEPENAPWLPATVALNSNVVDGTLATLDTTTAPDGLYSLRLTVNTEDGQSFHYIVTPIRINNARFQAVEERIRRDTLGAEGDAADEPEEEVAPPQDNVPRVTPSGIAVNVRRCDIADNDRCPAVEHLATDTFAVVTGHNRENTWYQIRLETGVSGWAARSVILESGDFGGVPLVTPPTPLPPPVVVPPQQPPTNTAIPTGMAIEGGTAVCNQQFNVQINIGNVGSVNSAAGTITLQDVNVRTGEVTFTGYGNYPLITPGGNFVVVIPVNTSVYFNEQHELRAFSNGRQFTIRYTLGQGNCNTAAIPVPPATTQRTFSPGECNVSVNQQGEIYDRPNGSVLSTLATGVYSALQVQAVGGINWYQIALENNAPWIPAVPYITFQGNCGL